MSITEALESEKVFLEQMRADIAFFQGMEAKWLSMSKDCRRQWKKIERQLKKRETKK